MLSLGVESPHEGTKVVSGALCEVVGDELEVIVVGAVDDLVEIKEIHVLDLGADPQGIYERNKTGGQQIVVGLRQGGSPKTTVRVFGDRMQSIP